MVLICPQERHHKPYGAFLRAVAIIFNQGCTPVWGAVGPAMVKRLLAEDSAIHPLQNLAAVPELFRIKILQHLLLGSKGNWL